MRWEAEVTAAVNQVAKLRGIRIDPALVHAVINKETRHGALPITGTREPTGGMSYGPMQVLDTTAQMHGIANPATLAIPSLGIRIGTLELARLSRMFGGDTTKMVAAYNGGPGIVARRNPATGRYPNQPYVDEVLSLWERYRSAVMAVAPAGLAIAVIAVLVFLSSRRRLAWG